MKSIFSLSLILAFVSSSAMANPVSFKDGWGVMPAYTTHWSDVMVNYSPTSHYSLGASVFYRDGNQHEATFSLAQASYLLKRWNESESQANIYLSGGLGERHGRTEGDDVAGYGAVEADYETRRIYTLFAAETLQSPGGVQFNRVRYRAGVAPYKAPFDKLQTWLIMQVDYMPEMEEKVTLTPLVRFFYNNLALEAGSSLHAEPYLAVMAHF